MTIGIFNTLDIRLTVKVRQLLRGSQEDGAPPKFSKQLQLRNNCTWRSEEERQRAIESHILPECNASFCRIISLYLSFLLTFPYPQPMDDLNSNCPIRTFTLCFHKLVPPAQLVEYGHTYVKGLCIHFTLLPCPIKQTPKIPSSFNPTSPPSQPCYSFSPNPPPFSLGPPPPPTSVGLYNGPQLLLGR